MKLLVISDAHGNLHQIRRVLDVLDRIKVDAITYSGDFIDKSIPFELAKAKVPVFAVPGNMDDQAELEAAEEARISIHGKLKEYMGYHFVGIGAINFSWTEKMVRRELENRRLERLILITHFPPKKTKADVAFYKAHIGSSTVRRFIEDFNPILCACGHVHESRSIDMLGSTLIVNPGPVNRGFGATVNLELKEAELITID